MNYGKHAFVDAGFTAIAAHRGGASLWPENSVEAFEGAMKLGVDAIELDVHLSADDEVMVFHDPMLDRTTGSTGPLRARSSEELQVMLLEGSAYGIPLLSTWAKKFAAANVSLSLELKSDIHQQRYAEVETRCLNILQQTGTLPDAMVHSFDFAMLRTLHDKDKTLFLGANVEQQSEDAAGSFDALVDEVCKFGARNLNADFRFMTPDKLAKAHEAGLTVTVWTVNDDDDLTFWLKAGVDALATDEPRRALELRAMLQGAIT